MPRLAVDFDAGSFDRFVSRNVGLAGLGRSSMVVLSEQVSTCHFGWKVSRAHGGMAYLLDWVEGQVHRTCKGLNLSR